MNPRIRELALQAGLPTALDYHQKRYEKFSELIAEEVFAKIDDEGFEIYQPVREAVMKHFRG